MNDLIHSMAEDLSAFFIVEGIVEKPLDSFLDPLVSVLGKSPDQADVLELYTQNSNHLRDELVRFLEVPIELGVVKSALRQAIRNYYGPKILP